jgi:predicted nucleic acid-binding protein
MPASATKKTAKPAGKAPIVLDSWALMAFLEGEEPAATTVRHLLEEAEARRQQLCICLINLGEVYYRLIVEKGKKQADTRREQLLRFPLRFVSVDDELVWSAAELKGSYRISYADAFAAALSLRLDARLASGDPDFKDLESGAGLRVRWLSRGGKK